MRTKPHSTTPAPGFAASACIRAARSPAPSTSTRRLNASQPSSEPKSSLAVVSIVGAISAA